MKAPFLLLVAAVVLSLASAAPSHSPVQAAPPIIRAITLEPDKPIDPQWMQHTYRIRIRAYSSERATYGAAVYPEGTGVSIGGGRILTAAHLADGCQAGYVVEAKIGEKWTQGRWAMAPGKDLATVTLPNQLPAVPMRTPKYGENVAVYGLRSGKVQQGISSNTEQVSLYVEEPGIIQGDSGGGIFGDDGCLIGTIRACNPNESRVVYFTPSVEFEEAPTVSRREFAAQPQCQNGVCRRPY